MQAKEEDQNKPEIWEKKIVLKNYCPNHTIVASDKKNM